MNITQRINARKIVLWYLYWLFFLEYYRRGTDLEVYTAKMTPVAMDEDDSAFLSGVGIDAKTIEKQDLEVVVDRKKFDNMGAFEDDVSIIASGLWIDAHDVDREYVLLIGDQLKRYMVKMPKLVDKHANQFMYEDMEITKKALFVLWYTESKVLQTDTKVIINEMVELAKRFGWADTFKLINSIFHNLLIEDVKV